MAKEMVALFEDQGGARYRAMKAFLAPHAEAEPDAEPAGAPQAGTASKSKKKRKKKDQKKAPAAKDEV